VRKENVESQALKGIQEFPEKTVLTELQVKSDVPA
jgi:hypothetical protein